MGVMKCFMWLMAQCYHIYFSFLRPGFHFWLSNYSQSEYKTSETPKINNIFIYLRFDYISVIIRIKRFYPDDD